jgi:hypothetical protein
MQVVISVLIGTAAFGPRLRRGDRPGACPTARPLSAPFIKEGWPVNMLGIDSGKAPVLVRGLRLWVATKMVAGSIIGKSVFWQRVIC